MGSRSLDVVADDWFRHISAQTIVQRALQRLEAKGRGILQPMHFLSGVDM
jgi:hypothetical protein